MTIPVESRPRTAEYHPLSAKRIEAPVLTQLSYSERVLAQF
jgi:hypothetical protein